MAGLTETARRHKPANLERQVHGLVRYALFAAVFSVVGLTGCNGNGRLKKDDPLFGDFTPKNGTSPNGAGKTKAALPAYPEATATSSTAAMAMGDPLAGSRPLHIGDGQSAGGWHGTSGQGHDASLTSNPGGSAVVIPLLRRPEPIIGDTATGTSTTAHSGLGVVPSDFATDYRQLQAELSARRVSWQRLEPYAEGFKFTCAVPNPQNPDFQRIYQATARDAEAAMQAVLLQIDQQR